MAADKPFKLQIIRLPSRERHIIPAIPSSTTLSTLQSHIHTLLALPIADQQLYNGFPPKELDLTNPARTLTDAGIRNGDTIEVRVKETEGATTAVDEVRQGKGWEYPATVDKGVMQRKQMPSDNSCLFHSINYVCNNRTTPTATSAASVRETVANVVASDPVRYSTLFLGSPNSLYQQHIMSPDSWGGAIELSILATHYQTEVVTFDYKYLREDVFGRGEGWKRRVFLLYTGDHYDVLVWQAGVGGGGGEQVVFSTKDDNSWLQARSYISSLHGEGARRGEWSLQSDWRSGEGLVRKDERRAEEERQKKANEMKEERKRDEEKTKADLARKASAADSPTTVKGERKDEEDVVAEQYKCSHCTLYNSMSAMTCVACGAPSPHINEDYFSKPPPALSSSSASAHSSSSTSASKSKSKSTKDKRFNGSSSSSSASVTTVASTAADTFICNFCTFHNTPTRARCEMCNEPNPSLPTSALTADPLAVDDDGVRAPIPQQEEQLIGGFSPVAAGRPRLGSSQPPPPPLNEEMLSLEWSCPDCTSFNSAYTTTCEVCGRPHPLLFEPRGSTAVGSSAVGGSSSSGGSGSGGRGGAPLAAPAGGWNLLGREERWVCETCHRDNPANLICCPACKSPNVHLLIRADRARAEGGNCSMM